MAGSPKEASNNDITLMLGRLISDVSFISEKVNKLDQAINGNGKPGIIEDHRQLQLLVKDHLRCEQEKDDAVKLLAQQADEAKKLLATEEKTAKDKLATETKARKEKISGRVWAVIMIVIAYVITQGMALLVLFIRTGGIK